ncbi:uncharacterized protein LOC114314464 [Camellia sinensis]|uniref:uncharacterized protein LOC114314464 n=1 Tax=Camellia sinensis TaxID=4442 RepID=UPI001035E566|nr:uncharacterized protein LOC114314464 [Camellia sinensis]
MIITGDDTVGIFSLKQFLSHQFEMKDLGLLSYIIGLEISYDPSGYFLTQAKYISDLLTRAGLTDCKTAITLVDPQTCLTPLDGHLLSNATLYRQLIGSLVYLTVTRPDIAYVVHILHAFSYADWAGDPTNRRSSTRFCFFLGDSLITGHSNKQTLVARSSTESVIQIAHIDVFHYHTKHIEIDCHFIRIWEEWWRREQALAALDPNTTNLDLALDYVLVEDLLDENGEWDLNVLQTSFPP